MRLLHWSLGWIIKLWKWVYYTTFKGNLICLALLLTSVIIKWFNQVSLPSSIKSKGVIMHKITGEMFLYPCASRDFGHCAARPLCLVSFPGWEAWKEHVIFHVPQSLFHGGSGIKNKSNICSRKKAFVFIGSCYWFSCMHGERGGPRCPKGDFHYGDWIGQYVYVKSDEQCSDSIRNDCNKTTIRVMEKMNYEYITGRLL